MKLLYGLLGIITLLPTLSPLSTRAETPPPVIFSEINWAGSAVSTADEWLELANITAEPINLAGWTIMNGAGAGNPLPLPQNSIIPGYGTFVVANYALGDLKTTLNVKADAVTTAVSLANSGLNLSLITPDGTTVDTLVTGNKPSYGSTAPYASAERNLKTLEWQTTSASTNLTKVTQFGTPGVANVPVPTPTSIPEPLPAAEVVTMTDLASPEVPLEAIPQAPPSEEVVRNEPVKILAQIAPEPMIEVETRPIISTPTETQTESYLTVEPTTNEALPELVVVIEPVAPLPLPAAEVPTVKQSPPAEEAINAPTSYPIDSVIINEFVSDPNDGTEWIEVINTTDEAIDLTGWTEKDASTSKTVFPAQILEANCYFVLQNPKGKLNNDGDSLFVMDATGKVINAILYDKKSAPKKGQSLSRDQSGTWRRTEPTPLTINTWADTWIGPNHEPYATTSDTSTTVLNPKTNSGQAAGSNYAAGTAPAIRLELEPQVEASVDTPPTASPVAPSLKEGERTTPTAIPVIDASEITNYSANTTVTVEGVLVAGPGTFGKQLAYVDGLEVYFNKADWPKIKPMTRVRITGTVDVKANYTRLKIKKRTDIKVIGDDSVAPSALETLSDAAHGLFMSVTGSVVDVTGKTVTIDLENGESITATSAKDASVDFSELAYGDRVAMSGVTRLTKGTWTITLLNQSGLTSLQAGPTAGSMDAPPTDSPVAPSLKEGEVLHSNAISKAPTKQVPWVGGGLLTTSIGALGYWFAKAKGLTLPSFS